MNSDWIQWILISEFIYLWIHIWIQNPYIWIHYSYTWIHFLMNSYIHFIYAFRYIWIHIIISCMNSYNDYMNSQVYEFICIICLWIYMNSYMNSYKLWIHMIFSYMNSHVSWIHICFINSYMNSGVPRFQMFFSPFAIDFGPGQEEEEEGCTSHCRLWVDIGPSQGAVAEGHATRSSLAANIGSGPT